MKRVAVVFSCLLFTACVEWALERAGLVDAGHGKNCRVVSPAATISRGADVLFVIDNSGSMHQEHEALARSTAAYGGQGACDLMLHPSAVSDLKEYLTHGPGRDVPPERWGVLRLPMAAEMKATYDDCGFIERLSMFNNDFQLGIVTTDNRDYEGVGQDRLCLGGDYPNGRSALPQRGCLMPVNNTGEKVIRSTDTVAVIVQQFSDAVLNVGTCGSGLEEGLKSITEFLSPDSVRSEPGCVEDYRRFLRRSECLRNGTGMCIKDANGNDLMSPEKKLVIVVISDEEDCSNVNSEDGGPQTNAVQTAPLCYAQPEFLTPTADFVAFLRGIKRDPALVSMVTIVGGTRGTPSESETFTAGDCRCAGNNPGDPPDTACSPVQGNSQVSSLCGPSAPNALCGALPNSHLADGGIRTPPCCTSDHGNRYVEVARGLDHRVMDSICSQSYKRTMAEVADIITQTDVIAETVACD